MTTTTDNQPRTSDKQRGKRRTFSPGDDQRQYDYEVLDVARVVRVVKGGRRFSFRASVVAGDRAGKVGFGIGKSRDVQAAINKAYDRAAKNMMEVNLKEGTVPYEISDHYAACRIMLKPARPGTGIISGGVVRTVADLVGVKDLVSKRLGSTNKLNTVRATLKVLEHYKK